MRELELHQVHIDGATGAAIVILADTQGSDALLPVFVRPPDAQLIGMLMTGMSVPDSPLLELIGEISRRLGARIEAVELIAEDPVPGGAGRLEALVCLEHGDRVERIEMRTGEALVLAARLGCSIRAHDALVVYPSVAVSDEDLEAEVAAFGDFIASVDPSEFAPSEHG